MSHREAFPLADLRSLAHKDWPYAGSAHEWRGFVRDEVKPLPERAGMAELIERSLDELTIYQKQNFGPKLD
jgi:hypothetical protein